MYCYFILCIVLSYVLLNSMYKMKYVLLNSMYKMKYVLLNSMYKMKLKFTHKKKERKKG